MIMGRLRWWKLYVFFVSIALIIAVVPVNAEIRNTVGIPLPDIEKIQCENLHLNLHFDSRNWLVKMIDSWVEGAENKAAREKLIIRCAQRQAHSTNCKGNPLPSCTFEESCGDLERLARSRGTPDDIHAFRDCERGWRALVRGR